MILLSGIMVRDILYAAGALVLEREPQHVIDRACPYCKPGVGAWDTSWVEVVEFVHTS